MSRSRTLPVDPDFCSRMNTRLESPGGAVTYTGEVNPVATRTLLNSGIPAPAMPPSCAHAVVAADATHKAPTNIDDRNIDVILLDSRDPKVHHPAVVCWPGVWQATVTTRRGQPLTF